MYDPNETMLAKLQAGGGSYSVIYPSDYMVRRMVELDLLSQLEQARLSSLNNLFPRFQNPDYDLNNRHSALGWGQRASLNTQKLTVAPDWDYLGCISKNCRSG